MNMPEELGSYDVAKLRHRARERGGTVSAKRFDESEWIDGEIECIAFSSIKSFARFVEVMKRAAREAPALAADLKRHTEALKRVIVCREWCISRGRSVADITYSCPEEPDVIYAPDGKEVERSHAADIAADLVDCEQMVRSVRFDRPT